MSTRNRFSHGLALAVVVSLLAAAGYAVAGPLLGHGLALRLLVAATGLVCVLFVLREAEQRTGRITAVTGWLLVVAALWVFPVPLGLYLLVHVGLIWLIRSLVRYASLVPAAIDLVLSGIALVGGLWAAMETRSVGIAFWVFLLVQALHVKIPRRLGRRPASPASGDDRFDSAFRTAEAALRRLHG